MTLANDIKITPELVKSHGLKPDEYERFAKLIGQFTLMLRRPTIHVQRFHISFSYPAGS
jgi:hypothetical protein